MPTVVHGTKDALDQMVELTSALFTRIQSMPETDVSKEFFADVSEIREKASHWRERMDGLDKRNKAIARAAEDAVE